MKVGRCISSMAGALVLVVLCNCHRKKDEPSSATTTTGADVVRSVDMASARVARVRCEHDFTCDRSPTTYRDVDTCVKLGIDDAKRELTSARCPSGLDESQVSACVSAIQRTSCYDPIGLLMQLEDCKADRLCAPATAP